jgi:hypothetical protein
MLAAIPALPSWWVGQFHEPRGPFHLFIGGDPQRKGERVTPGSLSALSAVTPGYELSDQAPEADRRLALARWLVAPENPLTPRVLANRLWHYHFGTGIVDTPSDFGAMGSAPTHPKLLDWPETYRRAVSHQNARSARVDVLSDFDCPDGALAAPRRTATTTSGHVIKEILT